MGWSPLAPSVGQPERKHLPMTAKSDASTLPKDWAAALAKRGFDQKQLDTLVTGIYDKNPESTHPDRSDHLQPTTSSSPR